MKPDLSLDERKWLRQIYTPQPLPKCPICGEELSLQDSKERIYACNGMMPDPAEEGHLIDKPGRSFLDQHYKDSWTYFFGTGDPRVIKALDRLEAMEWEESIKQELAAMNDNRQRNVALHICSEFVHRALRPQWLAHYPMSGYEFERDMSKAFGALALRAVLLIIQNGIRADAVTLLGIKLGDQFDGVLDAGTEETK